jgi:hypothetical protein
MIESLIMIYDFESESGITFIIANQWFWLWKRLSDYDYYSETGYLLLLHITSLYY